MSRAKIIAAMESGADRAFLIARRIGKPLNQVYARLHELKCRGIVCAIRLRQPRHDRYGHRHGEKTKRYLLVRSVSARQ